MKTLEKIRPLVFAEIARICPEDRDYNVSLDDGVQLIKNMHGTYGYIDWKLANAANMPPIASISTNELSRGPYTTFNFLIFYRMLGLEARDERERAAKLIARVEKLITPKEEAILFARSAGSTAVASLLGQINGSLTSAIEDYKKGEQS